MHALLMPMGSSGDVNPFVGLGRELLRRGHRVTIQVNGQFAPFAKSAGLEVVEAGTADEFRAMLADPLLWHPTRGFEAVMGHPMLPRVMRQQVAFVREHYRAGETVILAGTLALGARAARDIVGGPLVSVHLQPTVLWSLIDPPMLGGVRLPGWLPRAAVRAFYRLGEKLTLDKFLPPLIEPLRREAGLPPVTKWSDWWHSPDALLALFPRWYATAPDWPTQLRQTSFPLHDEGNDTPLPAELAAFLDAGSPPIAVTFGSAMQQGREQFAAAVDALKVIRRRGVIVTRLRKQLPDTLPDGVIHVEYAPFGRLFPRCAAVIHHGGIGTTGQALAAGIPQFIMPLSHDQPDNAERLRRLGVGRSLRPKRFHPPAIVRVLNELLNDATVGERCRDLAGRVKPVDGVAWSVDEIEAIHKQF